MPEPMRHLVLGGARSGKSTYAEQQGLAMAGIRRWVYVATADAGDHEMAARIEHHRAGRDACWTTVEEPLRLAEMLNTYNDPATCILVDCLTLWLGNCLARECWAAEQRALIDAVSASRAGLLMVSNEVGSGVVPLGEMSRQFVDESGRLHQQLARMCDQVTMVVAGLPLTLKSG